MKKTTDKLIMSSCSSTSKETDKKIPIKVWHVATEISTQGITCRRLNVLPHFAKIEVSVS
jgi:hypothetical protein